VGASESIDAVLMHAANSLGDIAPDVIRLLNTRCPSEQ
jgi:hypothetical protein